MSHDTAPINTSWAGALPPAQGLYDPSLEKDACGVGFLVDIQGRASHAILTDAEDLLCNMTHRGATGADVRDGDGAGVMTALPHDLFVREFGAQGIDLPAPGEYATGNIYFSRDPAVRQESLAVFEQIAAAHHLRVLGWRQAPVDNSMLGPTTLAKEPFILQPMVVMAAGVPFDARYFESQLYVLRKHATHTITLSKWFYICSLSNRNIIYKGLLNPKQVHGYFRDLADPAFVTHFALVHSRFSTNTFPSWDRAQPLRWCAHNGEINTLRGNKNWMRAREGVMRSELFGDDLAKLCPVIEDGGSDSAAFDNVLELLVMNGVLSLPEAVMTMVPEAWQNNPEMDDDKRAFYEWAATVMEPWDGPALFTFSDGRYCGAILDRNGLRPCRYYTTKSGLMVVASEVGAVKIDPAQVASKGRLQPGRMLLVDTKAGRVVDDAELKRTVATRRPFRTWVKDQLLHIDTVKARYSAAGFLTPRPLDPTPVAEDRRLRAFGFTLEHLNTLLLPMVRDGKEALGSMGHDAPLACMADQPRLPYDYFRQLFAQVTNPPIDPIREEVVMSLECYVGPEGNLLAMEEDQCRRLTLPSPVLSLEDLDVIKNLPRVVSDWPVAQIDLTFPRSDGLAGYERALERVCEETVQAITDGYKVVILSDTGTGADRVPLSTLLAVGGVHHHLVRQKLRSRVALIVETGEAREIHHLCVLLGYGADGICPYLALESMLKLHREGVLGRDDPELTPEKLITNYRKACDKGIRKVMAKMGISTLQSYKGAQIFEILGLDSRVVTTCFAGTASRVQGSTFAMLAADAFAFHESAYPTRQVTGPETVGESGDYHWRSGGVGHVNDPTAVASLQDAVRRKNQDAYATYSQKSFEQIRACTLRGLLDFRFDETTPIPIEEVEPWTNIVQRCCTGAMSYGSISWEAHSSLALAMNQLGGKSNTGEGGEDPTRSEPLPGGGSMRSAIKQVASGRFGVTNYYLSDADEIQIKMAQGAKAGEGGELPGFKVTLEIARTRKTTPGVGLISPPPHHDIYSIEDLKQLIYDLKCTNPRARISVKLVSEVGVGIVASGVAKARADHILISGHDGGTGAAVWTGIKYAGLPWELGLAEAHQTLVLNDLRGRVVLQTDGQIRTGRDVAIACLLGAEEWGFATTPLIALGCVMLRKCHLATCAVGIATQDPALRRKFAGTPEHVVNFFYYVAEELRGIMAQLGLRTINEMVGRVDLLRVRDDWRTPKTRHLDLTPILTPAFALRTGVATHNVAKQNHKLDLRKDNALIRDAQSVLTGAQDRVVLASSIVNTDRAFGATLSHHVSRHQGESGLPDDAIHVNVTGSAGQSFGAFLAPGVTLELEGDANDYVGKGLSGGHLVVYPPRVSTFKAAENVIVGNVCLYGATSGKAFFSGRAAERFAVRNSGAAAVVEGVGDHGCEYMTGGRVVILGPVGRNFAAGMSGGIAYVLSDTPADMAQFRKRCNLEMVELETVVTDSETAFLRDLLTEHATYTGSLRAQAVLDDFAAQLPQFVKVMPVDYKRILAQEAAAKLQAEAAEEVLPNADLLSTDSEADTPASPADEPALIDMEDAAPDADADRRRAQKLDKVRGFMKYRRQGEPYRNPTKRTGDWKEINARLDVPHLQTQAARCMDCGIPFCQSDTGCPIGNIIPKWNDLVFRGQWYDALQRLLLTNNFPEFTGRVCPAPCEGACTLGINEKPVGIKSIECAIIDRGFEEGWMVPRPPARRTGRTVGIIGSGPAGLAAADQLNRAGHTVTVYDRNDRMGGLLVYGIPNMKLDKRLVQRRVDLMAAEGVKFVPNTHVGVDVDANELRSRHDALLVATGATWPRDLPIPNRDAIGVHFAMEFLQMNTKSLLDSELKDGQYIDARGKHVVVIGGGDTGNDCIGTSVRHGAASVTNFELLPQPPQTRAKDNPWPQFPRVFKVDYGHEEAATRYGRDPREYCVLSKEFVKDPTTGKLTGIKTVRVEWTKAEDTGRWTMREVAGSEEFFRADLVFLSMGFLGPEETLLTQLDLTTTRTSAIETPKGRYITSLPGVYAAGDCRRGQSLIVWGINEGRQAAREIDQDLIGNTELPGAGGIVQRDLVQYQVRLEAEEAAEAATAVTA
ncbi:glutamate synthase [NADH] [Tieghemiomyces parasiticus]|uniref:Glutamate synthase [NADH] n=1 Tax=Tieghemiomyces parasiticus TaxID=78921 RepID=A0A9W7ZZ26_9FUNG|nr:glutamate synthase [NADH] [Tieghemiomyces parasiticus]